MCCLPSFRAPAQPAGRARVFGLVLAWVLLLPWLAACSAEPLASEGRRPIPFHHVKPADPTRVVDTGTEYKQQRKQWQRERHRAPPDVDWAALEAANAAAQREKRNALAGMAAASTASRWTEKGSENCSGRIHAAARSPDGNALYAGSSLGGVWRGTLDGQAWTPLGDKLDGGAHWLVVLPGITVGDPDILLRATDGGLVHRSLDDGATWQAPAGLPATIGVRRLLATTDGSHSVLLLVRFWQGSSQNHRLYRSADRGATFAQVASMTTWGGDVWAPRTGPGDCYLLRNSNLWRSGDAGATWVFVSSLPNAGSEGEITGCEAGAPRLWVIQNEGGTRRLYRSDDAGASWNTLGTVDDYWGTLAASTTDVNLFAWGGVEVHRTTDGGNSFAIVNPWWEYYGQEADKLHADIPGLDVLPDAAGGETWYVCTDGGLYRSTDGLATVQNLSLSGLRVSQYYSTHTSNLNTDHVQAGAQDQGYQHAELPPVSGTTISFDQIISGDYGHLTSGDGSHRWVYSVYPGFILVARRESDPELYTADFPAGESHPWLPCITADPDDITAFFFCAKRLYRYDKSATGFTWTPVQWSNEVFDQNPGEYMTGLAFSPLDSNRAWATTNHGRIFWSADKGVTWTRSATLGPSEVWLYGTAIQPSHVDADTVYIGGSGYSGPAVWRSTDGGQTFEPWGQGLPPTLVYSLAEAPDGSAVFAGSESAAWRREAAGSSWVDITSDDAPITIYWSAEEVPGLDVIRFGTYGRGIWDYSLVEPCSYEAFGLALGGANTLTLDTASTSFVNQTQVFEVSGAQANASGVLIVGLAEVSAPLYGGTLLVNPTPWVLFGIGADPTGHVSKSLPVPDDPLLYGLDIVLQAALADTSHAEGWAFSNGLRGTLCE